MRRVAEAWVREGASVRPGRRAVLRLSGAAAAGALAACAGGEQMSSGVPPEPPPGPPPDGALVWLHKASFHHAEVVLPAEPGDSLAGAIAPWVPAAPLLACGFGEWHFFTTPEVGLLDAVKAMTPGPAAILAAPKAAPPPAADAVALPVGPAGLEALRRFVAADLRRDAEGRPVPITTALRPGGWFFAAGRRYSLGYTCNTWAVHALEAAGLPVRPQGILFAGGAMAEARRARSRIAEAGRRGT
jgi:hypothetical protein